MEKDMNEVCASEECSPMIKFNSTDNEDDEEIIGLVLKSGTQVLKIKSMQKNIKTKDSEILDLKAKIDSLEDDLEKYLALGLEPIDTMISHWVD